MRTTETLLSLPKSLYVCLRLLPFSIAIKRPIIVRYNCKIVNLSGSVSFLKERIKHGMLKIGFGRVGVIDKRYTRNMLEICGKMILKGKAAFGNESRISILNVEQSVILKGSVIPEGCVVGSMTFVNKQFEESNCLIADNPAIIQKTGISRIFNN